MSAYYNENDRYAAEWLRNLIQAGVIAPGEVDDRPIQEVQAEDVRGYTQCHFFAGVGGWSYALRLAGWPDDRPAWTGSCPCQPFSSAGQKQGAADERHLWPAFHALLSECRPATIFGEQVAGKLGQEWLSAVRLDLEESGYACGAADLCAAGVGAPHVRQRLFWVANNLKRGWGTERAETGASEESADAGGSSLVADTERDGREQGAGNLRPRELLSARIGDNNGLGNPDCGGRRQERLHAPRGVERGGKEGRQYQPGGSGANDGLGNSGCERHALGEEEPGEASREGGRAAGGDIGSASPWGDLLFIPCADGKARPVKPGIQPLAHGVPNRVGRLRAYGNAIVPQIAAKFVEAYMEV